MFGSFLLDQGVEMELGADLNEVVAMLDKEVPNFATDGYGFQLSVVKGVLGSEWRLLVKPVEMGSGVTMESPVGIVTISKEEDGSTLLKIPPRAEWEDDPFDEGGRLFTSFILHVVRAFQRLEWIDLPGPLPEE